MTSLDDWFAGIFLPWALAIIPGQRLSRLTAHDRWWPPGTAPSYSGVTVPRAKTPPFPPAERARRPAEPPENVSDGGGGTAPAVSRANGRGFAPWTALCCRPCGRHLGGGAGLHGRRRHGHAPQSRRLREQLRLATEDTGALASGGKPGSQLSSVRIPATPASNVAIASGSKSK